MNTRLRFAVALWRRPSDDLVFGYLLGCPNELVGVPRPEIDDTWEPLGTLPDGYPVRDVSEPDAYGRITCHAAGRKLSTAAFAIEGLPWKLVAVRPGFWRLSSGVDSIELQNNECGAIAHDRSDHEHLLSILKSRGPELPAAWRYLVERRPKDELNEINAAVKTAYGNT
ncbi:MAG: hypothetical protein HOW73_40410 [Polyangiaceae bacterium]|nr:hypothetical protein [Polyangiaceae bacterium]